MNRPYENTDLEPVFNILEDLIKENLEKAEKEKRWDWARALESALKPVPVVGKIVGIQKSVREVIDHLRGNDHIDTQVLFNMLGADIMFEIYLRQQASEEHHRLHMKILEEIRDFILGSKEEGLTPEEEKAILDQYLNALITQTDRIDIQGIAPALGDERNAVFFPIEELYTPLKTISGERDTDTEGFERAAARQQKEIRKPLTALLKGTSRLLIIGNPGGGKTTFLRLIAAVLAKDITGNNKSPEREIHLGLSLADPAPVPIFLRLANLRNLMKEPCCVQPGLGAMHLWIIRLLHEEYKDTKIPLILQKRLGEGKSVLLLDGLDEVPEPEIRQKIVSVVDAAMKQWTQNRIVITSRPFGYKAVMELDEVTRATVDDFEEEEIDLFLEKWVTGLKLDDKDERGGKYKDDLKKAILERQNIRDIAGNPVMLTCLCVVHWHQRKLPDGKADLLAAVLRWLINSRDEKRKERGESSTFVNECFKEIAYAMTADPAGKLASVELQWAVERLYELYDLEKGISDKKIVNKIGRKLLEDEMIDSGIIIQAAEGTLRFWHLSFQEHYAAQVLMYMGREERWEIIEKQLSKPQWNEVIDHLAGLMAKPDRNGLRDMLCKICNTAGEAVYFKTAVAVSVMDRLLSLLKAYDFRFPDDSGLKQALAWAQDIFSPEGADKVPIEYRLPAAEAIGRAGDPRFDPLKPNMLPIPGAENVLLGKYPVTVMEYKVFVDDGGYEDRRHWGEDWEIKEKAGWNKPRSWEYQLGHPTWPVTGLSWFESVAYCRWLSERTGEKYRLPKEAEWEQAAKNPKGGDFPWGEDEPNRERCNYQMNVGHATPVGLYPIGAAHGGHLDMSGNVWEWCHDWYDKNEKYRVLRGGGWSDGTGFVRASRRFRFGPDLRFDLIGFRISWDKK